MRKKLLLGKGPSFTLLFFLLVFQATYAQLNNFTLSVSKTDENCSGNGSLSFQVNNPTPGATFVYSIYLLPNTINPIGVTSANSITGLVAGSYRVVAAQTLGSMSNTQQQDVIILNQINPLAFQLVGAPQDCIHGQIAVYVTQGNPASYEIISGPVIVPPQTSNILQNLPVGQYVVRVNDICGDGLVQTYSLSSISTLNVSGLTQSCFASSCTQTQGNISITTQAGGTIYYPLTVQTTIIPPGGATPVINTQTIASGSVNPPTANASLDLPILSGVTYSYTIRVTDACGNVFNTSGNDLIRTESVEVTDISPAEGGLSGIKIDTCNMVPPLTVQFLDAPTGFDPSLFNPQHPGPFMTDLIFYNSTTQHSLPIGHYSVQVTDACGIAHDGECTIGACNPDIAATPICSTFGRIKIRFVNTAVITQAPAGFPFPIPYTANVVNGQFTIDVPLGTYTFEGLDRCDEPYTITRVIDLPIYEISADNEGGCETYTGSISIRYANVGLELAFAAISIVSAPTEFAQPLPYDASAFILPTAEIQALITGLAAGPYQLQITDVCGNIYPMSVTVPQFISTAPPTAAFLKGCIDGFGSIFIDTPNRKFTQVIMIAAPATFNHTLPYDVSFNLNSTGKFFMNDLPEGNYSFTTQDVCGVSSQFDTTLPGYHVLQSDVAVFENCGSFDLFLNHYMEQPYSQRFWLQRWNPATGQWVHPYTGLVYQQGTVPDVSNSYQLYNFSTNLNIALQGKFRVLKVNQVFSDGSAAFTNCPYVVIKEFEFTGELKVVNASGVLCSDGSYNTFITVAGVPPFNFRITSKDGEPFALDNGTSNYFSNLSSGMYNFQIEDHCGNIVNRLYDIATLLEPSVSQSNLCNGQNGKLMVAAAPFLSYQWWKAGAPTVILSTSNTLNFTPFFSSINAGQYFVRIYSNSTLSCLDKTLSYTIPTSSNPRAGDDNAVSVCGNLSTVNLFNLLSGQYDTTGSWQELTNSGALTGALWNSVNMAFGTYRFKYRVNGFCDDFDESQITIQLKPLPDVPEILSSNMLCFGLPYQFEVSPIFNANFNWSGPNNFSSQEQNPTIANPTAENAGLYTVDAFVDGCQSSNTVTLTTGVPSVFRLQGACVTGVYTLQVVPEDNSFDPAMVTYQWSGPNNFSSNQNPVDITGYAGGNYSVTVTTAEGCSVTKSQGINSTFCGVVPLGISPNDDGLNDVLDLTGLGREIRFKIFNRYGTMVYEQDDYTNQWHGQDYHNRQLPDATYFYYIKLKSGEEKTGWVYVTR